MCEAIKGIRENAKAEGRAEGRAEERSKIIEKMRKSGMTEEQIKQILDS